MLDTPASAPSACALRVPCIGVFDSGVGGLSILCALRERLPAASMIYVGDVAYAPYGDRSADEVVARSLQIVEWLRARGATMIVVACNTATVLAIEVLRGRWPALAFVGVEPGVKPAIAASRTRRIAVMATVATANSARLRQLIARHAAGAHVHVQPCGGLADAIERGTLEGPELLASLAPHCDAVRAAGVDTVVLGCTHYAFVQTSIRELLGNAIALIDTASAIAQRSEVVWKSGPAPLDAAPSIRVVSTGDATTMRLLLARCNLLREVDVEALTIIG